MEQAFGYTLTRPVSTAIIGISTMAELEENVRIAKEFNPFTEEEINHLGDEGKIELCESSQRLICGLLSLFGSEFLSWQVQWLRSMINLWLAMLSVCRL